MQGSGILHTEGKGTRVVQEIGRIEHYNIDSEEGNTQQGIPELKYNVKDIGCLHIAIVQ